MLDRIGVGPDGVQADEAEWATTSGRSAGNGLTAARDFARLGYLMLYEGEWEVRTL